MKSEDRIIGTCGFHNWSKEHYKAEIGYELAPEYWRQIIQFYSERDRAFEFQIVPGKADSSILRALADRGFYQSGFHTTLYCPAELKAIKDAGNIYIRALKEDEFDIYAEIHCLGTELSIDGKNYVAANNQVLFNR